jgi:anti-sigma factor RsiW
MSCEKYSGWMTEAALGELRAEREPELLAHAMECETCREELARARAVHEFVDRGVAALVASEPSPQFAAQLRDRIAQQSEPQRFPWMASAPVIAGSLALAAVLVIMVVRKPMHNGSTPGVASAINPTSVPSEAINSSGAIPPSAERTASTPNSKHGAQARKAAAASPEIIVPKGQFAAALQLSAAISSGRVDGSQLLAAQQDSEKPLDVKLIEIAPLDSLAPADRADRPE